jgi:hypothetical protein
MIRPPLLLATILMAACSGGDDSASPPGPPSDSTDRADTHDSADTSDTGGSGSASTCIPSIEEGHICITIDDSVLWEIHPNVSGFNLNVANSGIAPWDPRLEETFLSLTPGVVRWPTGIGYSGDWRTGQVDTDWALRYNNELQCTVEEGCEVGSCETRPTAREPEALQCRADCSADSECDTDQICLQFTNEDGLSTGHCATECTESGEDACTGDEDCFKADADRYGCLGDKAEKYLGYQENIQGKGYQPLIDVAELVARTGGRLEIHVNAMTDSPASATELVTYTLERDIPVDLWVLAMESFYFRTTSSPPVMWESGDAYANDMRAYVTAIETAYEDHNDTLGEGQIEVDIPPISISFSDAENDWQRVWDIGKESDPDLSDSKPGIADNVYASGAFFTAADAHWYVGSPSSTLDEARLAANHQLVEDVTWNIDHWFLPLSSDETLRPTMVFTEYNIQTTWRTVLAMVHAAEFVARATAHPEVSLLGFHSLTEACIDPIDGHRQTAKDAATYNRYGVLDSAALNADGSYGVVLDEYLSMPCLALQLVNEAINPATHALSTTVEGGLEVDAEDEESESHRVSSVFAQVFRGAEQDYLIVTNRSDQPQTLQVDGLTKSGQLHTLAGEDYSWRNCGGAESTHEDEICRPDGDLELNLPIEWAGEMIALPAWSVLRLDLTREPAEIAAPASVSVSAGARSIDVTWDPVEGASGYELRWGVRNALHHYVHIDDTQHTLNLLGADVSHGIRVAARVHDQTGPFSEEIRATPSRDLIFSDHFESDTLSETLPYQAGSATWEVREGVLEVDDTSGLHTRWRDDVGLNLNIQARFKLDCDCSVEDDCGRIGLVGRYQDEDNRIITYLDQDDEGCFFRIHRASDTTGSDVLGRSAYIGIPIADSAGEVPTNDDGSPLFPEIPAIDDGEWHTLRLQMEESVIRTWLDGRLVAAGLDDSDMGTGAGLMVRNLAAPFDELESW